MVPSLAETDTPGRFASRPARPWLVISLLVGLTARHSAADLDEAEALLRGKYDECQKLAAEEIDGLGWNERWRVLRISSELARGKYAEALSSAESAVRRFPASIPLRLLARDVYRYNGRPEDVARTMAELEQVVMGSPQRFATHERGWPWAASCSRALMPRRCWTSSTIRPSSNSRPDRSLPGYRQVGPGQRRPRASGGDPPQGAQGRRRGTAVPLPPGPHLLGRGSGRVPEGSRRSPETRPERKNELTPISTFQRKNELTPISTLTLISTSTLISTRALGERKCFVPW